MCSAGCGDGKVAVVMPPAAIVFVAMVGSCCCDCSVAVVITVTVLAHCKTVSGCFDQTIIGRRCVLMTVVDVVMFDEAVGTAIYGSDCSDCDCSGHCQCCGC
jgi:hypothetical protein